jgi:ribosomal protein L21E
VQIIIDFSVIEGMPMSFTRILSYGSVGIVMGYRLDGLGSILVKGKSKAIHVKGREGQQGL